MRGLRTGLLVMAGPLLLAVAGLVHPGGLSAATASEWVQLHVVLLPAFPLLALGFVVLLWGRPRADVGGAATVVAWLGAGVYAAAYTGLDAVAGIAAGTVVRQPGDPTELRRLVVALFDIGDLLGRVGVYAFLVAVLAGTVALWLRHGPRVLVGTVVLLGGGYSFIDSHIFHPRGVWTMLALGAGFALWTWAAGQRPRTSDPVPGRATPSRV